MYYELLTINFTPQKRFPYGWTISSFLGMHNLICPKTAADELPTAGKYLRITNADI